jgi:hypothetical protein
VYREAARQSESGSLRLIYLTRQGTSEAALPRIAH